MLRRITIDIEPGGLERHYDLSITSENGTVTFEEKRRVQVLQLCEDAVDEAIQSLSR